MPDAAKRSQKLHKGNISVRKAEVGIQIGTRRLVNLDVFVLWECFKGDVTFRASRSVIIQIK